MCFLTAGTSRILHITRINTILVFAVRYKCMKFMHRLQYIYFLHLFSPFHSEFWRLDPKKQSYLIFPTTIVAYLRVSQNVDDYN